jgi:hypothetical protein
MTGREAEGLIGDNRAHALKGKGPTPGRGGRGLCFPLPGRMCYNREAVKYTGMQEMAPAELRGAAVAGSPEGGMAAERAARGQEDSSRYCPICSQRLESRRCKLVCVVCGYYMSCSDYY